MVHKIQCIRINHEKAEKSVRGRERKRGGERERGERVERKGGTKLKEQ